MYCKDCYWWEKKYCQNEGKIGEDICRYKDENIDQLSYSYDEGVSFQTGPLFGCVHFRAASNNCFNLIHRIMSNVKRNLRSKKNDRAKRANSQDI